jgi:hypothetical protein
MAKSPIHIATAAGELFTLGTSQKLELHERIMASPAIANGVMYVRSDLHLHALLP